MCSTRSDSAYFSCSLVENFARFSHFSDIFNERELTFTLSIGHRLSSVCPLSVCNVRESYLGD